MVMNFFGISSLSPKKGKNKTIAMDDASLDSVSLNDGTGIEKKNDGRRDSGSNHSRNENYKYTFPNSERSNSRSIHESIGSSPDIDAKLLKEERHLQKVIAKSKGKPMDKKVQRATDKRLETILKQKVRAVTVVEQDLINRYLGVDEDGYCLCHQDQRVRTGIIKPFYRFETISTCRSCSYGATSGIEMKNHGQKDKTISHAVNGALVATGIKQKKKEIKGDFATTMNTTASVSPRDQTSNGVGRENSNAPDNEFNSDNALMAPSLLAEAREGSNQTPPDSLQMDSRWMEEVRFRVLQVESWNNNLVPLKCHPTYANYFRMLDKGIPLEEIRETVGDDGPDLLALSLDPNKPLHDQLDGLSPHVQERLRSNAAFNNSNSQDEFEIVDDIYGAYLVQLKIFDNFLEEDNAGIYNMISTQEKGRHSGGPESSPVSNGGSMPRKKRKLRIRKKIKRLVGAAGPSRRASVSSSFTSGSAGDIDVDFSEATFEDNPNPNPMPVPVFSPLDVGPVPLQALPTAGLRRSRRPTATHRNRRPSARRETARGVITANSRLESPKSSISPSPNGRATRKRIDPTKMQKIMSTSDAEELMEKDHSDARPLSTPNDSPAAPHKQQLGPPLMVIKSFPSTNDTVPVTPTIGKGEGGMFSVPKVIKSFPSVSDTAPTISTTEEIKPSVIPGMVIKSFPSTPRMSEKGKNDKIEPSHMVIKSLPSVVTASTKMESGENPIPPPPSKGDDIRPMIADLDDKGEHGHNVKPKGPFATGNFGDQNKEERKKEELRKAVEAMHRIDLGDDDSDSSSFGSIPTTIDPIFCPTTGEPSVASNMSSISSHSSDASSSDGNSGESSSDSDDGDDELGKESPPLQSSQENKEETVDMDEYIHISEQLVDTKAALYEANYLLENSKQREEKLMESNKEKDSRISKLLKTAADLQAHINTLSNQNAEAGRIMVELTATIEEQKRQQAVQKSPVASEHEEKPNWDEMRPKRSSSSNGISAFLGPGKKKDDTGGTETAGSERIVASEGAAIVNEAAKLPNVRHVAPKVMASNVRQVAPRQAASKAREVTSAFSEAPISANPVVGTASAMMTTNVREITPDQRRRMKGSAVGEGEDQVSTIPSVASPMQPAISPKRGFEPSDTILDKRRKKRELEEKLLRSVANSKKGGTEELRVVSRGTTQQAQNDIMTTQDEEEGSI